MTRTRRGAFRWLWRSAVAIGLGAGTAHAAVTLQLSSTEVAQQGDMGRICVALSSGGHQVAGVQNNLIWDGTCATLSDESNCYKAGEHNKDVKTKLQASDFNIKVLVLSLSDVDPIPDGVLYCCNFQSESEPGSCCNINVANALASDPGGQAIGALAGAPGRICTRAGGNSGGGGGGIGSVVPNRGSNAPQAPLQPAPAAPVAPAPAGGGAPPAVVMPGGGARVAAPPTAAAPAVEAVDEVATAVPTAAAAAAPPPPAAVPVAPVAQAPTVAVTPSRPPATPSRAAETATIAAAPTVPPTAAPPAAKANHVPAAAVEPKSSGWLGCQSTPEASLAPMLGVAVVLGLGVALRRRRR